MTAAPTTAAPTTAAPTTAASTTAAHVTAASTTAASTTADWTTAAQTAAASSGHHSLSSGTETCVTLEATKFTTPLEHERSCTSELEGLYDLKIAA